MECTSPICMNMPKPTTWSQTILPEYMFRSISFTVNCACETKRSLSCTRCDFVSCHDHTYISSPYIHTYKLSVHTSCHPLRCWHDVADTHAAAATWSESYIGQISEQEWFNSKKFWSRRVFISYKTVCSWWRQNCTVNPTPPTHPHPRPCHVNCLIIYIPRHASNLYQIYVISLKILFGYSL